MPGVDQGGTYFTNAPRFLKSKPLTCRIQSAGFWIIASAIASFYKDHGCLPLPGSLPDMKARSADYIRLQNVYRSKAQRDCSDVLERVRKTEQRLGRGNAAVDEKEVELFCKGAGFVKLVRGRPLHMTTYQKGETWGDRASYACKSSYDVFVNIWGSSSIRVCLSLPRTRSRDANL